MNPLSGSVLAISVSTTKGIAKTNVNSAKFVQNAGIEGDAHAGPWHRQISLLAMESIDTIRAKGLTVGPGAFAENITTSGINLTLLKVGSRIRVGDSELEITQLGKKCEHRCAIYYQAGDCIMPREGIFAKVIKGAEVRIGDPVAACDGSGSAF